MGVRPLLALAHSLLGFLLIFSFFVFQGDWADDKDDPFFEGAEEIMDDINVRGG